MFVNFSFALKQCCHKNTKIVYYKRGDNMKKLPIFLNLEGKKILVVGGGNAALIKIKTLLEAEADFIVISKSFSEQTEQILIQNHIVFEKKEILQQHLKGVYIVFAAAEKQVNDCVAQWAEKQNILCCKADGTGDFIVPYHKRNEKLTVAVSTDGLFPLVGKKICENMDLSIGQHLEYLAEQRKKLLHEIQDKEQRKEALQQLLEEYNENHKNRYKG